LEAARTAADEYGEESLHVEGENLNWS